MPSSPLGRCPRRASAEIGAPGWVGKTSVRAAPAGGPPPSASGPRGAASFAEHAPPPVRPNNYPAGGQYSAAPPADDIPGSVVGHAQSTRRLRNRLSAFDGRPQSFNRFVRPHCPRTVRAQSTARLRYRYRFSFHHCASAFMRPDDSGPRAGDSANALQAIPHIYKSKRRRPCLRLLIQKAHKAAARPVGIRRIKHPPRPIETGPASIRGPLRSKPHKPAARNQRRLARRRAEEKCERKARNRFSPITTLKRSTTPFLFLYAEKKKRGFSFTLSSRYANIPLDAHQ